jgi:GNAT superfamily N-acetyltransferase
MITLIKTQSDNTHFQSLVKELDKDLAIRDGDEHAFYAQFNKTDKIKHALVAYDGDIAVGCGAIRAYDETAMEVKRMWVQPSHRGKGIASMMLKALEAWTKELGFSKCVLETGNKQLEAIELYKKNNYTIIENYGPYQGVANSICFEKSLIN